MTGFEKELAISMLHKMVLIRLFENAIEEYSNKRLIYGMAHCCTGQEGVAVGVCSALRKEDYIISNHRPHGHAIAKGVNLNAIMSEIFGKATGTNGGKGGSMHIHDKSCGLITSTGIVGSGIPVACGAAFASKYHNEERITCVFLGDGAANEGVFYECLNLATLWKLPIIFVIEDNGLAVTTLTRNTSSCSDYRKLASVFGMKSDNVDGQDVLEVYNVAQKAVNYVRYDRLPYLIHAKTIRFNEHAEGSWYSRMKKVGYRNFDELEVSKDKRCPIKNYSTKLKEMHLLSEDELQSIYQIANNEVLKSIEYARKSPLPASEAAFENIFSIKNAIL